jgi:hypothetical protein
VIISQGVTVKELKGVRVIRREFLKQDIVPWSESYLYHGTPPPGLACMLAQGLSCAAGTHDWDYCLFSTSANDNVLTLFSDGHGMTGFVFNPSFKKVLVMSDFWYSALYGMSDGGATDMWDDYADEHPEEKALALKLGLFALDVSTFNARQFLEQFLPKNVEAIMFPGFSECSGGNDECEMAVTEAGIKVLERSVEYIYIRGKEFDSADAARKYLAEQGVECRADNPSAKRRARR